MYGQIAKSCCENEVSGIESFEDQNNNVDVDADVDVDLELELERELNALHENDSFEDQNNVDLDADLELELERELNALENDEDGGNKAPPSDEVLVPHHSGVGGYYSHDLLMISYAGQVYTFDNVDHEKFQDALYLLGISRSWFGNRDTMARRSSQRRRGNRELLPGRCSQLQRLASLKKYREKRMKRCFEKKIRYHIRQEVALRMHRSYGHFASKKIQDSGPSNGSPNSICTHCGCGCGVGSFSTPVMRQGPAGPKTLCNACGLYWKKHGRLPPHSSKLSKGKGSSQLR